MRRQPTEEQKQKAKEKRETVRNLCRKITAMTPEEKEKMKEAMPLLMNPEGHVLSVFNTMLVAMQGGDGATVVGGFKQWLKQGRVVRKGQHGFMIWFPRNKKQGDTVEPSSQEQTDTEHADMNFLLGTVFDVEQTIELEGQAVQLEEATAKAA